jgi:hypothetical protein
MNSSTKLKNPVLVIRDQQDASIAASIWCRNSRSGVWYDVTFARTYPKTDSDVAYTQTFGHRHLDALVRVASQAKAYIDELKENAETVTNTSDYLPEQEAI